MKKAGAAIGIILAVITLGWWTRRQRKKAQEREQEQQKEPGTSS